MLSIVSIWWDDDIDGGRVSDSDNDQDYEKGDIWIEILFVFLQPFISLSKNTFKGTIQRKLR
jgi:hypothetical protein